MPEPWKIYHHCDKDECDHALVSDPPELADRLEIVNVPGPHQTMKISVNSNGGWSSWDGDGTKWVDLGAKAAGDVISPEPGETAVWYE